MSDDQIKDEVRKSTDSAIQAITELVRDIQLSQRQHRDEEKEFRGVFKTEMLEVVDRKIDSKVNGGIVALKKQVGEMDEKLSTHISIVQPMIENFNNNKGFWNTLSDNSKKAGIVAAMLTGIAILGTYLSKLFLK